MSPLEWLDRALDVIDRTPHLTYLILTKRLGNVNRKLATLKRTLPDNVWAGATIGHAQSLPLLKPCCSSIRSDQAVSVVRSAAYAAWFPASNLTGID